MDNPPAGSSKKATIYVGGFASEVNEEQLLQAFVTFGDIIEISIPKDPHEQSQHRGYAFLTFANPADAQDAIDNYDLNELPGYAGRGKFLKCNLAQPSKYATEAKGDKFDRPVWQTEEWLQQHGEKEKVDGEPIQTNGEEAA